MDLTHLGRSSSLPASPARLRAEPAAGRDFLANLGTKDKTSAPGAAHPKYRATSPPLLNDLVAARREFVD